MNSADTGHSGANLLIYAITAMGTFLTEEWYLIIMVAFGFVHVYIAYQRNQRDKKKFELEMKALQTKADTLN